MMSNNIIFWGAGIGLILIIGFVAYYALMYGPSLLVDQRKLI